MHATALDAVSANGLDAASTEHPSIAGRPRALYPRPRSCNFLNGLNQDLHNWSAARGFHRGDISYLLQFIGKTQRAEATLDRVANIICRDAGQQSHIAVSFTRLGYHIDAVPSLNERREREDIFSLWKSIRPGVRKCV